MRKIRKRDLLGIIVRSFYIQATWNFERMLALGLCFCLIPVAKRLYKKPKQLISFLHRHLEFFNAHPYLASVALGAIARLEEQALIQKWADFRPISVFKERMCGTLGALGDQLFWILLRPLAAMVGVIIILITILLFQSLEYGVSGVVLFLIIYNIPHLYARSIGVIKGYQLGFDIVRNMSFRSYERYFRKLRLAAAVSLGILIPLEFQWAITTHSTPREGMIAFAIGCLGCFILAKNRFPINYILILLTGLTTVIGILVRRLLY